MPQDDRVSRRRYERERRARAEAERLLELKSRALYEANKALTVQAVELEQAFQSRTQQLRDAIEAAERANDAKSGFLAMISHEIRTPLNGVLGMATVLAESDMPPEQQEMAQIILSSGQSLLTLLNDVLDLSKIEARKMEIEARNADLHLLCVETQQLFRDRAKARGLVFELEVNSSARRWVRVDPTRLRQVLGNLLSNAIKFTERGGVYTRISVADNMLEIRVRDTGPGVPPEQRDKLFEAFAQTDASITRRFGGTGLGLSISREICRLMGGDLVYRAEPSGGSCFIATMKIHPVEVTARTATAARFSAAEVLRRKPWRILAAEDSLTNQKVLRLLLRDFPLLLDFVGNGADAVEMHCADPFDLILMDVNMPVLNGMEAAAMIRENELAHARPRVPIIALTANAMTHQVSDYLGRGVDAHVAKPIQRDQLTACMAQLLSATPACQAE